MDNLLQKRRLDLGLTLEELSEKEDVQWSTVSALENNRGVNREMPRAMRMLIRLDVPYLFNDRGSIYVNNHTELHALKGAAEEVVYENKYYEGLDLGNGLLQKADGSVYYNELRDAIAQSDLNLEEFAELYSVPLSDIIDVSIGRRAIKDNIDLIDMLDDLSIRYDYNPDDSLYIKRHFKVSNNEELATYLEKSLYTVRTHALTKTLPTTASPDTGVVLETDDSYVDSKNTPWFPLDSLAGFTIEPASDVIKESLDSLDTVKADLKTVLQEHKWSDSDSKVLKHAFQIIGMKQLEKELDQL